MGKKAEIGGVSTLFGEQWIAYADFHGTRKHIVEAAFGMIRRHIRINELNFMTLLDPVCGSGSFFDMSIPFLQLMANDVDAEILAYVKNQYPSTRCFSHNSLAMLDRKGYGLEATDSLLVIGNLPHKLPIPEHVKRKKYVADSSIKNRDVGISHLLACGRLDPDYICVLHPLSFLIRPVHVRNLKEFCQKYRLIDALVISNHEFSDDETSRTYPIVLAMYKREPQGMTWRYLQKFEFETVRKRKFCLKDFMWIDRYLTVNSNRSRVAKADVLIKFHIPFDINELRNNKTFVQHDGANIIHVTEKELDYCCYIEAFKEYAHHLPYYLGSCNIMFDAQHFDEVRDYFRNFAALRYPELQACIPICYDETTCREVLEAFFKRYLGAHWL